MSTNLAALAAYERACAARAAAEDLYAVYAALNDDAAAADDAAEAV